MMDSVSPRRAPIMRDSVLTEVNCRPLKIPKLQKACEGPKSSNKKCVLKGRAVEDDEYVRQYLKFYYQFGKSEGFAVDWEEFDYVFHIRSFDNPPCRLSDRRSSAEMVREVTLLAIEKYNETEGTRLVFVDHVQANYQFVNGTLSWLTFWAMDMNSSSPEPKIYQAKVWRRGKELKIFFFRLKPTDEEIAAVDVEPPSPLQYEDSAEPAVVFARAGPEDDPAVPFVFHRTGATPDPDSFLP